MSMHSSLCQIRPENPPFQLGDNSSYFLFGLYEVELELGVLDQKINDLSKKVETIEPEPYKVYFDRHKHEYLTLPQGRSVELQSLPVSSVSESETESEAICNDQTGQDSDYTPSRTTTSKWRQPRKRVGRPRISDKRRSSRLMNNRVQAKLAVKPIPTKKVSPYNIRLIPEQIVPKVRKPNRMSDWKLRVKDRFKQPEDPKSHYITHPVIPVKILLKNHKIESWLSKFP
ncbi:uncharacterized protein KNAG_0J02070 [Huiozyma naganishii CBS 8797]|uniref:Uncharacterized protein n=1 Tax=Huiozyma naganishii (strain ATCC MYA-139 / BCRC 22969 / CBS 8797 / KCTC 17520 / NBRC 10181 / NCYC 3082 / Yp74L-3) TaxID=1071383 RepID=J7RR21_HUIN7|nr:hypothetical protein KNAG_0J02070 [Kazachstania naganishii CBS 8797]CCK72288.1 hypothetical protein KNAG_0J02070 [Kazachstania naganishii CBS 8797]